MLFKKIFSTLIFCLLFISGCVTTSENISPIGLTLTKTIINEETVVNKDWSDYVHLIRWEDKNEAGIKISLFFDSDAKDHDGKLIVQDIPSEDPTNSYFWNTANIPNGEYFVYSAHANGTEVTYDYFDDPIIIQHPDRCLDISNRPNLLPNSGFEDGELTIVDQLIGENQWEFNVTSVGLSDRSPKYKWENKINHVFEGEWSIKIWDSFNGVNSSSAWEDRAILRSPIVDLPKGSGKFLLTAWIKTENVAPGHILFRIKYFDNEGEQLSIRSHGTDTFYMSGPNTSEWSRVEILLNPPHWDSPPYPENAHAEKIEVGISLDNSPGAMWVDNVSLVDISSEEFEYFYPGNWYEPPEITTTSVPLVFSTMQGTGTRVMQDPQTGSWWFVDPDNHPFWGIGTGSIANHKLELFTGLPISIYKQQAQVRSRHELNFNLGWRDNEGENNFSETRNQIIWLNFSSQPDIEENPSLWVLKDREGNLIEDRGHYFPDVFNPIWQEYAVKESQTLLSNDGWKIKSEEVIGYWTDNEIAYGDIYDFIWGDVAKLAFSDWLQGHNDLPSVDRLYKSANSPINIDVPRNFEISVPYKTPGELNEAWSSEHHQYNYSSFQEIFGKDKPFIRGHNDPVMKDLYQFERLIYKIYVDTIINNIRSVETGFIQREGEGYHHLIFSNRFHLNSPAAIEGLQRNMDIFSDFDVIAVNWYPSFNQSGTYHPQGWMELIKKTFHDLTGRPIFISEFGVAGEDGDDFSTTPYLYVARWRDKTVTTQFQRGWTYTNLISTWANLPYIIGAQWYAWGNQYGDPPFNDARNSGLVDDQNNYYVHLTDNVRSINKQIQNLNRNGSFSIEMIDWTKTEINICGKK